MSIIISSLWSGSQRLNGYFFLNTFTAIEIWPPRAAYAIGVVVVCLMLLCAARFITVKLGRRIAQSIRTSYSSVRNSIFLNPGIKKLTGRYPRFFAFIKSRTNRKYISGLPLTLMVIGFVYVLTLFFKIIQNILACEAIVRTDLKVAHFLEYIRNPSLTQIFLWITLLGQWQIIAGSSVIVSIIFWLRKKRAVIVYLWLALVTDEIFNYVGKRFVQRDRPADPLYFEPSFSFPSGHAMVAVIFYGFLATILIHEIKNWSHKVDVFFACLVVILAIGFSRLYLGVHYFSDVWAGYLLGLLILMIVTAMYEWHREKRKARTE